MLIPVPVIGCSKGVRKVCEVRELSLKIALSKDFTNISVLRYKSYIKVKLKKFNYTSGSLD